VDKQLATQQGAALLEKVVIGGDLAGLSPADRVLYYRQVCESIGINPLTQPFQYIVLNGKLTLYARKDCTDQLRKRDAVSVTGLDAQVISDVYVVKAAARVGDRSDMATGAVSIKGLTGEALANAMLKAETKAKRRVTLSICGLGMLDETEAESVPGAQTVQVDMTTGEVRASAGNNDAPFCEAVKTPAQIKGFWTWAKGLGLSTEDVHAALKVEHLAEVTATVAAVKAILSKAAADIFPDDKAQPDGAGK
jgi:hypothetical protein